MIQHAVIVFTPVSVKTIVTSDAIVPMNAVTIPFVVIASLLLPAYG